MTETVTFVWAPMRQMRRHSLAADGRASSDLAYERIAGLAELPPLPPAVLRERDWQLQRTASLGDCQPQHGA